MKKWLSAFALMAVSAGAHAALDTADPDLLRLYKKTVRSVVVVATMEGQSGEQASIYGDTMRKWVEAGLRQNGYLIEPQSKSAPELRFGGYCGKAVDGCSLKMYVSRDLWYELPDGKSYRVPGKDLIDDKLDKKTTVYKSEEMFPLFVQMLTRFIEAAERSNPEPTIKTPAEPAPAK